MDRKPSKDKVVHYLAYQPVVTPEKKPTPKPIVFDASSDTRVGRAAREYRPGGHRKTGPAGIGCAARPEIARRSAGTLQFTLARLDLQRF
ncbi:hypothetical protein Y032_0777g2269 [Ancylostoma ceylanicum]|uniref:Uncharacterized protein n=1 Tax=Ancylostoma ceylanicum TaxID=53326 RepID=A0A016WDC6_9BILA|nr:hypothetical protein Y032_0777g2269 [Ancylostoma ceylanicum]